METDIVEYINSIQVITSEKEKYSTELNIAARIQSDMLPSLFPAFPERHEFDVFATMTPAKEVGGDFYDFFLVDYNHIALVMGDVSGKGVPASLFMVISRTLIKYSTIKGGELSPSKILADVNNQLCEGNDSDLFVTVWVAIIDLTTGIGVAANAGHEHPAIKRANGKYELSIYKHSPALAVMEDIKFAEHEFKLYPGDKLFVYTDGVTEATNIFNELYGSDRLVEALNKEADASNEVILNRVQKSIDTFTKGAPQFDDITMLGFTYYGDNKGGKAK